MPTTVVENCGHTRLTHGHLMSRNDQQPTWKNAAYGNRTLTIKPYFGGIIPIERQKEKCNIQSDIKTLLGKDCKVKKRCLWYNGYGIDVQIWKSMVRFPHLSVRIYWLIIF